MLLVDLHHQVVGHAAVGEVHRGHLRHQAVNLVERPGSGDEAVGVVDFLARENGMEDRLLPAGDGGDFKHPAVVDAGIITRDLGVGAFGLPDIGQDPPFDDELRIGPGFHPHGLRFD